MTARVVVVARETLGGHSVGYTPRPVTAARRRGYQARSISAVSSSRLGGPGVKPSSGRCEDRVERLVEPGAVGADRAEARRVAAELEDRAPRSGRARCRSPRRAPRSASGARGAMNAIARGRIAALVSAWGLPQTRTRVWQIDVVEGEQAGVDRVAAEDRAERQGAAVAASRAPGRARRRSARPRAARSSARPGWRTACRASRRRARGRSSRSPAASARAGRSSPRGRRSPGSGGPVASTRSSAPAGSRWIPVISAPESVVGIAATSAPLTEAIAFAVSITRPPPKATRRSARSSSWSRPAAVSGTWPGGTRWTAAGRLDEARRLRRSPARS